MKQNLNLNEMSIDELKICAYDLLASKEQTERNLQIVNQTIAAKYEEQKKNELPTTVSDATIES
jgi:hypothetical protein